MVVGGLRVSVAYTVGYMIHEGAAAARERGIRWIDLAREGV
jgi:hypothetical protein